MKKYYLLFFIIIISLPLFAQVDTDKFTVQDFYFYSRFNGIDFSPGGEMIAYALGEKKEWDGKRNYNIWIVKGENKGNLQLTTSEKNDWDPKWSPDGSTIAFLSTRSEKTQVYTININRGEATQVTFTERGVNSFEWIDNSTVAFLTDEPRDSVLTAREEKAGGGYVFGTTFHTSTLWTQSIKDESVVNKITDGSYYISEFAASSDGSSFLLITAKNSDLFESLVNGRVLWVDSDGKEFYSFNDAKVLSAPAISPDGTRACFVGNTVGYSSNNALFLVDKRTREAKNLTTDFDPTINEVEWIDNENISFRTPRNVYSGIYSVNINGEVTTLFEPHYVIYSYSLNTETNELSFIGSSNQIPNELFVSKFKGDPSEALQLTNVSTWVQEKTLGTSKVIQYPSYDGTIIEAVLTLPPDYDDSKPYPLMVLPHGGPDGIIMDRFNYFGHIFSQEGLVVFEPNFRGGIGYGSEFYAANRGKLGYVDYDDIMAGVDYLIKNKIANENKMVLGGWSYGGYMTNWIIGHTDRFKAAVSVAGVTNTVSNYAQSDINHGEIAYWEFVGLPVTDVEQFTNSSPLEYLKNAKTPTLIMHGEADDRVHVMQSWEIYRALEDIGVDVEMVLYPGSRHSITPPKQRKDVIKRWVEWYKKYLN
ncbi:MAG: S9 family peptidase [Ignavibacteria bacterium]|nr:S9 family peptidase [Ignavibacteria bacterium]